MQAHPSSTAIIYVLGGAQDSLKYRFGTAASLYKEAAAHTIAILSRPGITEYDPSLKRNLRNDEWSIKTLRELGVRKEDVELLGPEHGFFGTLTEAEECSREVVNRAYDVLILVSSYYHTARVQVSFAAYLDNRQVKMFIYGADDCPGLFGLLLEYLKLIIYRYVLL